MLAELVSAAATTLGATMLTAFNPTTPRRRLSLAFRLQLQR
jgi:hypothetical protein